MSDIKTKQRIDPVKQAGLNIDPLEHAGADQSQSQQSASLPGSDPLEHGTNQSTPKQSPSLPGRQFSKRSKSPQKLLFRTDLYVGRSNKQTP